MNVEWVWTTSRQRAAGEVYPVEETSEEQAAENPEPILAPKAPAIQARPALERRPAGCGKLVSY
jgi:hypothetical protein